MSILGTVGTIIGSKWVVVPLVVCGTAFVVQKGCNWREERTIKVAKDESTRHRKNTISSYADTFPNLVKTIHQKIEKNPETLDFYFHFMQNLNENFNDLQLADRELIDKEFVKGLNSKGIEQSQFFNKYCSKQGFKQRRIDFEVQKEREHAQKAVSIVRGKPDLFLDNVGKVRPDMVPMLSAVLIEPYLQKMPMLGDNQKKDIIDNFCVYFDGVMKDTDEVGAFSNDHKKQAGSRYHSSTCIEERSAARLAAESGISMIKAVHEKKNINVDIFSNDAGITVSDVINNYTKFYEMETANLLAGLVKTKRQMSYRDLIKEGYSPATIWRGILRNNGIRKSAELDAFGSVGVALESGKDMQKETTSPVAYKLWEYVKNSKMDVSNLTADDIGKYVKKYVEFSKNSRDGVSIQKENSNSKLVINDKFKKLAEDLDMADSSAKKSQNENNAVQVAVKRKIGERLS